MEPALLPVPEGARYIGIGKSKLWMLIRDGVIPVVRIGRAVRVPRTALDGYIRQLVAEAGAEQGAA